MTIFPDTIHILLADDDKDDIALFRDILEELPLATQLKTVFNGEQLMYLLNETNEPLPDVLFLDLNMPRKNGFDCLSEIKRSAKLKELPVIIFSTSYESQVVHLLYEKGARFYIRKPNSYNELKRLIHHALVLTGNTGTELPLRQTTLLP